MARYAWVIFFGVMCLITLIGFFYFFLKDWELMKKLNKKKRFLLPSSLLLILSASNLALVIYLYNDIQRQIELLS